ncbi:unnamed protein product [Pieris macdunnoughi]|uniref:Uncharacterized protein n=1 Tax=Pieris macdunnoughi TaxID=345717 RepID=A0A821PJ65_9NEOP|nr:unnamed protein product [Pieris macdunnoughi]
MELGLHSKPSAIQRGSETLPTKNTSPHTRPYEGPLGFAKVFNPWDSGSYPTQKSIKTCGSGPVETPALNYQPVYDLVNRSAAFSAACHAQKDH